MKLYYYANGTESLGPFTLDELKTKDISSTTLIWHDGLENWTPANQVEEVKAFISQSPPPLYATANIPPPLNSQEELPQEEVIDRRMFKNLFSSDGRIRRSEYFLSNIILLFYFGIISAILDDPLSNHSTQDDMIMLLFLMFPACWFLAVQSAKRCHDLGNSGWFQFIPFYHFILLLGEGSRISNKYGPSPK